MTTSESLINCDSLVGLKSERVCRPLGSSAALWDHCLQLGHLHLRRKLEYTLAHSDVDNRYCLAYSKFRRATDVSERDYVSHIDAKRSI